MAETEYQKRVLERFDAGENMTFSESSTLDMVYYGPAQYGNESVMLAFLDDHPSATLQEVHDYWDSITPDGLPPGMTEADLADGEDD